MEGMRIQNGITITLMKKSLLKGKDNLGNYYSGQGRPQEFLFGRLKIYRTEIPSGSRILVRRGESRGNGSEGVNAGVRGAKAPRTVVMFHF